jgi:tRNA(Glu) U13 pseudouridine synthase TruD
VPTGPLPGGREIEPPPGTPARAIEDEAIAAVGATRDDFARAGRELPGARRPVLLKLAEAELGEDADSCADARAVRVRFTLPAGAYATVVVASLVA